MTRTRYLFDLACLCNCPPPVADAMGVGDFARLIAGISEHHRRQSEVG